MALVDVVHELETSRNRLLSADGRASQVTQLLAQRETLRSEIEDLDGLPVADDTKELAAVLYHDPPTLAATGGEDYELLISAPEQALDILTSRTGVPLTVVGEVTETGIVLERAGAPVEDLTGWDHFG